MRKILSLLIMFLLCQQSWGSLADAYQIYVTANSDAYVGRNAELTLNMKNRNAIWTWECTLVLPDGVTFRSAKTSGGRYPSGYNGELTTITNGDGSVTIQIQSSGYDAMTGTDGKIATVSVDIASTVSPGDHTVTVKNTKLTELNETTHENYTERSMTWTLLPVPNELYLTGPNGRQGQTVELSLNLRNSEPVVGWACALYFPEGIVFNKLSTATDRYSESPYKYSFSTNDGGTFCSASCFGNSGFFNLTGTDGAVATISISIPDDYAPGDYNIEVKTISLSSPEAQSLLVNETSTFAWKVVDEFTINFDANGGSPVESITQDNGSAIVPPAAPTREGHTFIGWEPALPETMPVGGLTVTAQWEVNKYNITYKVDGETYKTEEVNYGTSLNGPTPVKKGMTFSGWEGLPETMPAHDVTATGTFSWSKETIDGVIYQVTDTLSNLASVVGNDNINGEAIILSSVEVGGDTYIVDKIKNNAFRSSNLISVTIPNSVTSIGNDAFNWCAKLTSVTIGDNVTTIGTSAFQSCYRLASLTIGNSVTTIGQYAFTDCDQLISVTIPNSVTTIGHSAFLECNRLTSVTIGSGVTSMSDGVFLDCYNLSSVTILNGVTSIGDDAFSGCTRLKSILIPNSVISIGSNAFALCGLESLTIPGSVTSIGSYIFNGCTSLASVTIPSSITSIPIGAFMDCTSLTAITIPSSVTKISSDAFKRCNNLTFMKVDNVTPCTFYSTSFTKRTNAVLSVPAGSKSSYEAADYWKDFKKIIEYIEGDVNVDEEVDVLDVVDIARFVVGSPAESFVEILADINKDYEVNLGDAVTLVNTIAGDQNFVKAWSAPSQTIANDVLHITESNGTLSLNLENERDYTAFQFDLYVPENSNISQMMLNAGRRQGHQLLYNKVEEGHYRVAVLSTSNQIFNGNAGELLNITMNGTSGEEVSVRNIRFFDAEGHCYLLENVESTIATSLTPTFSKVKGEIYDIQGRKLEKLQRGVNIVGGKKVVVK